MSHVDPPILSVSKLTFSGGSTIAIDPCELVVFVGPNNAGKSATLRGIREALKHSVQRSAQLPLSGAEFVRHAPFGEAQKWLEGFTANTDQGIKITRSPFGDGQTSWVTLSEHSWQHGPLGWLATLFVNHVDTEHRLSICKPPNSVDLSKERPNHPILALYQDDQLERSVSDAFRRAFGVDLIVHRAAGSVVPLYVGRRPVIEPDEDRVSRSYLDRLESLPRLESQGDGMKSYAGILIALDAIRMPITLIDEPEAFLHPPQARLLGQHLGQAIEQGGRQIFVATHSIDLLQGILDSRAPVKVVRLTRSGESACVYKVDREALKQLWQRPLFRHSNILDALFHEGVVLCEGDSDARFYSAIAQVLSPPNAGRRPDLMFTYCGGKARFPEVIAALRSAGVAVHVIADFDLLRNENLLKCVVEAQKATWSTIEPEWKTVTGAIDQKAGQPLDAAAFKRTIWSLLSQLPNSGTVRDEQLKAIRDACAAPDGWSQAKESGTAALPRGKAQQACTRLLEALRHMGIHVVPHGELESFVRTIGGRSSEWVSEVLQKHEPKDSLELETARRFVSLVVQAFTVAQANTEPA